MNQFTLPLSLPIQYSAENFYISESNRNAHTWIMRWPHWPVHALFLCGPVSSGKTHLAYIWAQRTHANIMDIRALDPEAITTHCLVEDIEQCPSEADLFHLFNICKERGVSLLVTANSEPAQLPFVLPDLTSRLKSIPVAAIFSPDDELLSAVMRKQFSDRQLMVDDEIISYLVPRIERSLSAVYLTVETLDRAALSEQKNITIPFVKRCLSY